MNALTAIIHDSRRIKKDGTFPVKLRITYKREQKYYPTKYNLTGAQFQKVMGSKPRAEFKEIALDLYSIEKKAQDVIDTLRVFNWEAFDKSYRANKGEKDSVISAFTLRATELRKEGQIGTAVSYECAHKSFIKFSSNLKFSEVTPDFLRKYERWMLENGRSITTVSMYIRSLRTLFNNAIADGYLSKDYYPFGKRKYEIPTGNNIKKALTLKEIASIFNYETEPQSTRAECRDYWIFMYLCNGINVKDMCLLKYHNINDDVIEFHRSKTARTKRKVEPIRVPLTEELNSIIKRRGNKRQDENSYIFPILSKRMTPERERQLIQQLTHLINEHMKEIAVDLGISKTVTTYAARHSFATVLQRSGVSTDFISEALGHSNLKTTQNYLAGFEDKSRMEAIKALTAFETTRRA